MSIYFVNLYTVTATALRRARVVAAFPRKGKYIASLVTGAVYSQPCYSSLAGNKNTPTGVLWCTLILIIYLDGNPSRKGQTSTQIFGNSLLSVPNKSGKLHNGGASTHGSRVGRVFGATPQVPRLRRCTTGNSHHICKV